MDPISVLLVDDNPTFLAVTSSFLQKYCQKEVLVAGTAGDGREALEMAGILRPEVMLLDLMMPGPGGMETVHELRRHYPRIGLVVLSLLDVPAYHEAALAAGADAFVTKGEVANQLLPAIQQAAAARGLRPKFPEPPVPGTSSPN